MDPRKLLDSRLKERLPGREKERPFRYLGRRVVQAMAAAATSNLVLARRSAPGRYLAIRLVAGEEERAEWQQQFAEGAGAIELEVQREAAAREVVLRSPVELALVLVTEQELAGGGAADGLADFLVADEAGAALGRLAAEREVILPRPPRSLMVESEPPGAQIYLDDRPAGVTPCRLDDVAEGPHSITLSRPGSLPHQSSIRIEPGGARPTVYRAVLTPEPEMGILEVVTFPPGARVSVGEEARSAPARWRLPAGPVEVRVELEEFEPLLTQLHLPEGSERRPHRLPVRLRYAGPLADEVVGRLIVYRPGSFSDPDPGPAAPTRIGEFFRSAGAEGLDGEWALPVEEGPGGAAEPEVIGERPLRRGVLLIGREDPASGLVPDVRLFDAENSVSRGCHAWIWIYADTSTGAAYNTFLVGNNSPAGIRVDGQLVMETRRLSDDAQIDVGNFRLRLLKSQPEPRVEFGF